MDPVYLIIALIPPVRWISVFKWLRNLRILNFTLTDVTRLVRTTYEQTTIPDVYIMTITVAVVKTCIHRVCLISLDRQRIAQTPRHSQVKPWTCFLLSMRHKNTVMPRLLSSATSKQRLIL